MWGGDDEEIHCFIGNYSVDAIIGIDCLYQHLQRITDYNNGNCNNHHRDRHRRFHANGDCISNRDSYTQRHCRRRRNIARCIRRGYSVSYSS